MVSMEQLVNRIREIEFPVLKHEMRMRRRQKHQLARILIYLTVALMCVVALRALGSHFSYTGTLGTTGLFRLNRQCFIYASIVQLAVICVLIPVFSASTITVEREKRTFDLLALTLLSSPTIIGQKLMVAMAEVLLLLVASSPAASIMAALGGMSPLDVVITYGILLATAFFVAAGGVFWSCVLANTRTATFVTYASMVGMYVGVPAIWRQLFGRVSFDSGLWWNAYSYPVLLAATLVVVAGLMLLSMHLGPRRLRDSTAAVARKAGSWIRSPETLAVALILGLIAFLMMRLGTDLDRMVIYGPALVNPLSAIADLTWGSVDWEVVLATLSFSTVGTVLLLHLSVRRFEALRCS